jgi:thioredoxin 2
MDTTVHVGCAHCGATNRIDLGRARQSDATCGKCRRPLFEGHPVELTEANYAAVVERTQVPVIVDFWAEWCGPCRMMAPQFERAAQRLEPDFRLAKLDTEAAPSIAARFGIRSIPTIVMFRDGREVARHVGATDATTLERWARTQPEA